MIKRAWISLLILFLIVIFSGVAEAKLIKIGTATYKGKDYSLIYEDDQDLIWLDYTNTRQRFAQQTAWVEGLNARGVLTYNFNPGVSVTWQGDWRLPKTVDGGRKFGTDGTTTAGYNITTSEMGHLFYVSLGNVGYYDKNGNPRPGWGVPFEEVEWGLKKTGPFENLQVVSYYSSTTYEANPVHAWHFLMYLGYQQGGTLGFKSSYSFYGLAVRPATVVMP